MAEGEDAEGGTQYSYSVDEYTLQEYIAAQQQMLDEATDALCELAGLIAGGE